MPFYNEINNRRNFSISFAHRDLQLDFSVFAKGYKNAADSLVEEQFNLPSISDYNCYPIVFLYRHAFELQLKNVLYCLRHLKQDSNKESANKLYNIHKLYPLAEEAKKEVLKCLPYENELEKVLTDIIQTALEFEEIDFNSFSYRYPINTMGHPSTPKNQIVNLESLYNKMNHILNEFETLDFCINAYKESVNH